MSSSYPPFPRPAYRSTKPVPAFPLLPYQRVEKGLAIATGDLGTAFFISERGLFLTAAHLVRDYLFEDTPLRVMFFDEHRARLFPVRPDRLVCHQMLDVALGLVEVPSLVGLQRFTLAADEVPAGDLVRLYGFSHTEVTEQPPPEGVDADHPPGLKMQFWPAFHEGQLDSYNERGFGLAKGPVYAHTAETLGATSGGPLIHVRSSRVCGVTCSGAEEYGTATDVRAFLDWPITFFEGKTLRDLAKLGLVSIGPTNSQIPNIRS